MPTQINKLKRAARSAFNTFIALALVWTVVGLALPYERRRNVCRYPCRDQ